MMKIKKYNVYIITKTGLHIGSWNANVWIGEMDNPIIKNKEGFPYIPASSLKWKLRSLYELKTWKIWADWWPYEFDWENYDEISMFFGKAWKNKDNLENLWPTRFIFRDLNIAKKEDIEKLGLKSFDEDYLYTQEDYENWQSDWDALTEEKTEVAINRNTWTAWTWWQFAPRPVERVFAWTVFKGELIVRFFEKEDIINQWNENKDLLRWINEDDIESIEEKIREVFVLENKDWNKKTKIESEEDIMKYCFWYGKWEIKENDLKENKQYFGFLKKLLEDDYLGWMWTRGSGQVEIIFEEIK